MQPLTVRLLVALLALLVTVAAPRAADKRVGTAAYGDWTTAAIGTERIIKPDDLPAPYASTAARNPPSLVRQPAGAVPQVPPGFTVTAFVSGIESPRQMRLAPNGDIFLAESGAGRIRIIRAAAGATTVAGEPAIFADHLPHRPYGIAFYPPGADPHFVYVGTEGEVLRFPYHVGDLKAAGPPETIAHLPVGHHWTRDVIFSPDGRKLLVAVGSGSNDAEDGMGIEANRADILEFNPDGTGMRIFASGIRNPVSLAFYPGTDDLWTTVNERDGLGDNLPPDYATRVTPDGFYGWPWYYIGGNQDPRHKGEQPELQDKVLVPDVLFQPHSAPLGLAVYTGEQFPAEYRGNLFVAFHGSWNRAQRTGYKLVRIVVRDGKPVGGYEDFMLGFVTKDGNVWGRPVGVAVAADGALLVSDDGSGTVWRVAYAGPGRHAAE